MVDLSLAYPTFPIFGFITTFLVLIPLPWHLQVWNAGTCMFMLWTAIATLNFSINSVVWHGNAVNWAPAWCDICAFVFDIYGFWLLTCSAASRVIVASSVGIPAAAL